MKRTATYILTAFLLLLPVLMYAQAAGGQVKRPVKNLPKLQLKPVNNKRKPAVTKQIQPQDPVEAAGYDVTFNCNISTATLYIDGISNGLANGSRFLKTGSHTVKIEASGYETLSQNIIISSGSKSFTFTMKKKETQLSPIIQNLINNMVYVEVVRS